MISRFTPLPGLPGEGPASVQFSATGQGMHREGFVVEFASASGERWVGNFQPGLTSFSTALRHPNGRSVVVISGGQAYEIDPNSRALIGELGGAISEIVQAPHRFLLVFSDGIGLRALGPSGIVWRSERISWDGIRALAASPNEISGEAYDPMQDIWISFSVDLDSGAVRGGSYSRYVQEPTA